MWRRTFATLLPRFTATLTRSTSTYRPLSTTSTHTPPINNPAPTTPVNLPDDADIVIIGGGVIGTSIAYHLAKEGAKNVLLLEKSQLTHGCTWHAAGLLGQLRTNKNLTRMLQYSASCFSQLEADTGINPDWAPVGSLRLACTLERWKELKRSNSQAVSFGFDMRLVSPQEAKELCPIMNVDDVIGAAYIPTDGHMDPSSLTNAFATGARQRGVQIAQGVEVTRVTRRHRRITEIHTRSKDGSEKTIRVQRVVNAGGIFARELGLLMGISVPTVNVEHQYMVSEKIVGMPPKLPSIRDPDHKIYYKTEVRGLAIGGWEHDTIAVRVPHSFGPELYNSNFDRFGPLAEAAAHRTPCLNESGIKTLINGPIPVSPDGEPIIGKAPEMENVFVAAGFTAGIGASGGAGKYMAEWILYGEPSIDLWPLDIRRFGPVHNTRSFLEMRTVEAYGNYYRINPPGVEMQSARPMRTSPIYDQTLAQGAIMGSKFGWERPLWFSTPDKKNKDEREKPSYNRPAWFDAVGKEHAAVREKVGIIDQSSFAKLEVSGPRALDVIQHLIVNDASGPPGTCVYTQMCNAKGGIEADITVVRLEEEKFYVITGSGFGVRDFTWIRDNIPASARNADGSLQGVTLTDVTNAYAVINVCGPRSRDVLEKAGVEGLSNQVFPFMTYRNVEIGLAPVRAVRVTFVGELGWELHIPVEYARTVYKLIMDAGLSYGITPVGYRAIESLRLEKGYRVWGSDITPGYNPYEAGLGFCVKLKKNTEFIGKQALSVLQKSGVERKFACFLIDEKALNDDNMGFTGPDAVSNRPLLLTGNEAIVLDGKVVGATTSAGYGYTVGRTIIYGYVPTSSIERNDFQLHAYGKLIPITIQRPLNKSLYDDKREKILA